MNEKQLAPKLLAALARLSLPVFVGEANAAQNLIIRIVDAIGQYHFGQPCIQQPAWSGSAALGCLSDS